MENSNKSLIQPDYLAVNGKKDTFSFTWNWGQNILIANFNPIEDVIDLRNFWIDYTQFDIREDANGNTIIDLKALNNQTITLQGVSLLQLRPENITGVSGQFPVTGNVNPITPNPPNPPIVTPSLPTITIDNVTVTEGDNGTKIANFNLTLSEVSQQIVSVNYATSDGTAKQLSDYIARSGTISFNPGQTQQKIAIEIKGDTQVEPAETFFVQLSNPSNAILANTKATGTILNNDRPTTVNTKPVLGAYYPEWAIYGRNYQVADVPADKLTNLYYAFAKIDNNGEVAVFDRYAAIEKRFDGNWNTPKPFAGNFEQLKILKQKHPHLKTSISIGGWSLSNKFSDVALTNASRQKFAKSAVNFMTRYGFDGIDIDWEYPVGGGLPSNTYRPQDKQNYTLLLKELDKQIQAQELKDGKDYELTIASPGGFDKLQNYELKQMSQYIDFFNVMAYDYHGAWERNTTNHNAPLYRNPNNPSSFVNTYNIDYTIQYYLAAGVSADKIVMGAPLYGRTWGNVKSSSDGLFAPAGGPGEGTWEPGVIDYRDLYNRLKTDPNYVRHWDNASKVPYVYNQKTGFFSTYEDTQSLNLKLDYTTQQKLRGMFFWEASGDLRNSNDPNSLINLAANRLGVTQPSPLAVV